MQGKSYEEHFLAKFMFFTFFSAILDHMTHNSDREIAISFFERYLSLGIIVYILQGCTNCVNLEMEPKHLTKSDIQLKPNISRTKHDQRVL